MVINYVMDIWVIKLWLSHIELNHWHPLIVKLHGSFVMPAVQRRKDELSALDQIQLPARQDAVALPPEKYVVD